MHDLRERWRRLWDVSGSQGSAGPWFDRLCALYGEPHRAYHNLDHLRACFDELERAEYLAKQPRALEWALWFHDAVYDPHRVDNEARSADLAAQALIDGRVPAISGDAVRELILATKHDGVHSAGDPALICDIDLAILGQKPSAFERYDEAIRKEYAHVDEETYIRQRTKVLQSFLAQPHVFATPMFRGRYEAAARANLERALRQLRHAGAPA